MPNTPITNRRAQVMLRILLVCMILTLGSTIFAIWQRADATQAQRAFNEAQDRINAEQLKTNAKVGCVIARMIDFAEAINERTVLTLPVSEANLANLEAASNALTLILTSDDPEVVGQAIREYQEATDALVRKIQEQNQVTILNPYPTVEELKQCLTIEPSEKEAPPILEPVPTPTTT